MINIKRLEIKLPQIFNLFNAPFSFMVSFLRMFLPSQKKKKYNINFTNCRNTRPRIRHFEEFDNSNGSLSDWLSNHRLLPKDPCNHPQPSSTLAKGHEATLIVSCDSKWAVNRAEKSARSGVREGRGLHDIPVVAISRVKSPAVLFLRSHREPGEQIIPTKSYQGHYAQPCREEGSPWARCLLGEPT